MITAEIIDRELEFLQSQTSTKALLSDFAEAQPDLIAFLHSPGFDILTEQEKDYSFFLSLVIWRCATVTGNRSEVVLKDILEAEEQNWQKLNEESDSGDPFSVFFSDPSKEELLTFVEDSLDRDENDIVTPTGQVPIFIYLKSLIDCLVANDNP